MIFFTRFNQILLQFIVFSLIWVEIVLNRKLREFLQNLEKVKFPIKFDKHTTLFFGLLLKRENQFYTW